jgi:tetratricopeptide (TPR) repeat protein
MSDDESTELSESNGTPVSAGSASGAAILDANGPELVPAWIALLVLAGLLLLAGAAGCGLNSLLRGGNPAQRLELANIAAWQAKVAQSPNDAESRLRLGSALQDAGQLDLAILQYEYVLQDDPKNIAALYGRGDVLMKLGHPADAEASFWAVLAQDPGHARAAEALGEYYASKKQYRSLIQAVRPAVVLHPTEARLQYLMGLAYENIDHPDWAVTRYRLALDAVPDMPEALAGLARLGAHR